MEHNSLYPIRAVAKLVGMTTDSIRAWERRYGAINPARSKGGRLYSDYDVKRLMLLKQAVDHGHSIGQIATLADEALQSLPIEDAEHNERSRHLKKLETREIERILGHLENYDCVAADRLLGSMAALQSPRTFVHTLVLPLVRRVGENWQEGRMNIAQEHMLSAILRNLLGTLLRLNSKESPAFKMVFTTLPGERHEFGILSAAMLAAGTGMSPVYLGPDLPVEDTLAALEKTEANALVLSLVAEPEKCEDHLAYLRSLHKQLPSGIDVILGGYMSAEIETAATAFGFEVFGEMKRFEVYLEQQGGRF